MKIKLSYLYVALILFTLVSCAKEEITTATIDLRENVIGQYNFNIKTYIIDIENKLNLSDSSISELKLNKAGALNEINFNDLTGKIFVKGSNFSEITTATKGYKFDILNQEVNGVSYKGYNYFTVDGKGYHGNYNTASKKVFFAFTFKSNDIDFVLTAEGTKK